MNNNKELLKTIEKVINLKNNKDLAKYLLQINELDKEYNILKISIIKIYIIDKIDINNIIEKDIKEKIIRIISTLNGMFNVVIDRNHNILANFIRDDLFKQYIPKFSELQDYKKEDEKNNISIIIREEIINAVFFNIVTNELIPILEKK